MTPEPHCSNPAAGREVQPPTAPADGSAEPRRRRLPDRRLTETRQVVHRTPDGRETVVSVSIGYDPAEPAQPREVFYDAGYRSGADLEFAVQDLCVIVSLLLQHGIDPSEIGRSLSVSYGPDDAPHHGSLAGTIVAELMVPPTWAEAASAMEGTEGRTDDPDGPGTREAGHDRRP